MQEKGAYCRCQAGYFTPSTSQEMGESCGSLRRSPTSLPPLQSCWEHASSPNWKTKLNNTICFISRISQNALGFLFVWGFFVGFFPQWNKSRKHLHFTPLFQSDISDWLYTSSRKQFFVCLFVMGWFVKKLISDSLWTPGDLCDWVFSPQQGSELISCNTWHSEYFLGHV